MNRRSGMKKSSRKKSQKDREPMEETVEVQHRGMSTSGKRVVSDFQERDS